MKNLYVVTLLLGIIAFAFSPVHAQTGNIDIGAGLMYGSEVEAIGIQGNALIGVTEKLDIAPDITIFFPDESEGLDSWWEINGNVHYNVYTFENLTKLYGLAGLNIAIIDVAGLSDSNSEVGLNLGGGVTFNVPFGSVFGELRGVIGDADQVVFGGGVRFDIN